MVISMPGPIPGGARITHPPTERHTMTKHTPFDAASTCTACDRAIVFDLPTRAMLDASGSDLCGMAYDGLHTRDVTSYCCACGVVLTDDNFEEDEFIDSLQHWCQPCWRKNKSPRITFWSTGEVHEVTPRQMDWAIAAYLPNSISGLRAICEEDNLGVLGADSVSSLLVILAKAQYPY